MNLFSVPMVMFASLFITVSSGVLMVGVVGTVVLLARILGVPFRAVVDFRAALLRRWFSLFMGHEEHFGGLTIKLTGDVLRAEDTAIIVCTHRTWIDTLVLYSLARQVGRHGDVKFLAKRSLIFFPVFGLVGFVLDSVVFIQRTASRAGSSLSAIFNRLTDARRGGAPFWMIIYAEGTRRTPEKLAAAQGFAKKRDLAPLRHVLQPRTKGFVSTVAALRGVATVVYDITIAYGEDPAAPVDPSFLRMHFTTALQNRVVHVHQRRIPIDTIPKDEEGAKKWLYKLYEQKDELLEGYYKNKKFDGKAMRWNRMTWGYWLTCGAMWMGSCTLFVVAALQGFRFVSSIQ